MKKFSFVARHNQAKIGPHPKRGSQIRASKSDLIYNFLCELSHEKFLLNHRILWEIFFLVGQKRSCNYHRFVKKVGGRAPETPRFFFHFCGFQKK